MYLTPQDFERQIREDNLLRIIDHDHSLLEGAITQALEEMNLYLAPVYDTATEFARTGELRSSLTVMWGVDIALYHLHSRIQPNQVPQLRMDRYDAAIERLHKVSQGKLVLNLPRQQSAGEHRSPLGFGTTPLQDTDY
jgi:phage gp36-like protein